MHSKTWVYIPVRECDRTIFILVPQRQKKYILNSFKHFFFKILDHYENTLWTMFNIRTISPLIILHLAFIGFANYGIRKLHSFFLCQKRSISSLYFQFPEFFSWTCDFFFTHKKMIIIKKVRGSSFQYCNVTYWQFKYSLGQ